MKKLYLKAVSRRDGQEYLPYGINFDKKFILYGVGLRLDFRDIELYCYFGEETEDIPYEQIFI